MCEIKERKCMKKFDLNIEKVLEDWEIYHAIREVIANALDEQALTNSKEIKIVKDEKGRWHIRDFGRGIRYGHLTQNECDEKLENPDKVIGKFGVGLKDAFATFDRKNIKILIKSKFNDITLGKSFKANFEDITTLHALVSEPFESNMEGTDFILERVTEEDIDKAKDFFLKFSGEFVLEETQYGEALEKKQQIARIYINGLRVAEEENFLFSYNITSITKKIKKALNRERTNVGRSAYTDRIKSILLECQNINVAEQLVEDLQKFDTGESHDELSWLDVSVHSCKLLNSKDKVIFLTPWELSDAQTMVDRAKRDGNKIITIPENVKEKIRGLKDIEGNQIRDLEEYNQEWNESFNYKFISEEYLTKNEKDIFSKKDIIFKLIGGKPRIINEILISETMRLEYQGYDEASGVWDEEGQKIIIKRNQLKDLISFAGTLLHETAHATSEASDITIEFENELTRLLGVVSSNMLK
jgi:hypothetical protein